MIKTKKLFFWKNIDFYLTFDQNLNYQMTFQKVKGDSFCVGGGHRSATINFYGDITIKSSKVLIGYCSLCNRKKI